MEGKGEIRRTMRARRKAVPDTERQAAAQAICAKLLARADVRAAIARREPIAVYVASADEIDLTGFIDAAKQQGAEIAAPRWNGETYELARLESAETLVAGPHGILEPPRSAALAPQPSVWLVPGLAFTRTGKRIGYGGGWYDRFLSAARPGAAKLGIAYDFQVAEDLPSEPHDARLTEVVSPGD